MKGSYEAEITINGKPLDTGQSMTVRVALTAYLLDMREKGALGDDEHGERMRLAYHSRLREVMALIGGPPAYHRRRKGDDHAD